MNQEFIPYEQALGLKELGFDEPTICVYSSYGHLKGVITSSFNGDYIRKEKYEDRLPAPLYQQAFRWLREKYNLHPHYFVQSDSTYVWCIRWFENELQKDVAYSSSSTYEEAELECLKKLIEIVKTK